jgi:hypothetical protein
MGLRVNGIYQLLAYDDYVNLLRYNIEAIKKNTKTVIGASKEVVVKSKHREN